MDCCVAQWNEDSSRSESRAREQYCTGLIS